MAFLKVTHPVTGKPMKFVSKKAFNQYVYNLTKRQERALKYGKMTAIPVCEAGSKSFGMQISTRPQLPGDGSGMSHTKLASKKLASKRNNNPSERF
jgi:hypothetical protein